MTSTNRRYFIKTSAAAAAGAVLAARNLAAQSATLEVTISGLCALVKNTSGLDLLLPTAKDHNAELIHGNVRLAISGHSLSISGLPAGPVKLPAEEPCNRQKRWFANLSKLHPKAALVSYPEQNTPRRVAAVLRLSGGEIELGKSLASNVPGIDGVWQLSWDTKRHTQVFVEVAVYTARIAAGTLTLTMTPMGGGTPDTKTFPVGAGQKLSLTISNDGPRQTRNNVGYLRHFNHHARIFARPPAKMDEPRSSILCHQTTPPALVPPTAELLEAIRDAQAKGGQPDEIKIGTQRYFFTADDPICPIAYFDPGA